MKTGNSSPQNWNDILFENRNKQFGAYELRTHYHSRLFKSFMIMLFSLSALTCIFLMMRLKSSITPPLVHQTDRIVFNEFSFQNTKFEIESNKVPSTGIKKEIENTYRLVEEIKPPVIKEAGPTELPVLPGELVTPGTGGTPGTNPLPAGDAIASTISETPMSLSALDKQPEFPGGEKNLLAFLTKNIHFTPAAIGEEISGRVFVSFIINTKGEIESIKILRGLGYGLDEEVIRVLKLSPAWKPGVFGGRSVSTMMNLPVNFTLNR